MKQASGLSRQVPNRLFRASDFVSEDSLSKFWGSGYFKALSLFLFFGMSVLFYQIKEGWSFVDCVFFVITTIATVGYGTIYPTSEDSRIFTIFLMATGLVGVFFAINSILDAKCERLRGSLLKSTAKNLRKTVQLFQQRLYLSILWIVLCAIIGAIILQKIEEWSFITSLYFIVQTITVRCYF